jgi:hypothetical protein
MHTFVRASIGNPRFLELAEISGQLHIDQTRIQVTDCYSAISFVNEGRVHILSYNSSED